MTIDEMKSGQMYTIRYETKGVVESLPVAASMASHRGVSMTVSKHGERLSIGPIQHRTRWCSGSGT